MKGSLIVITGPTQIDRIGLEARKNGYEVRDSIYIPSSGGPLVALVLRRAIQGTITQATVLGRGGALAINAARIDARGGGRGRFPSNVILVHDSACVKKGSRWKCAWPCSVRVLDKQSGELKSGAVLPHYMRNVSNQQSRGGYHGGFRDTPLTGYGDRGGASRFFYQATCDKDMERYLRLMVRGEVRRVE